MFKEDLLTTNFVEKEKEKAINRIVNMEKQVYYPVYIKDDGSRDFIEKIVFNLHFRERSGDNWLVENDKFWNAQIEQINVTPTREIELVPRVGDHVVFLGKIDNFEEKLGRLKIFYEKALNKVGWNKYERINLEFSNQIICTKREETNKPV